VKQETFVRLRSKNWNSLEKLLLEKRKGVRKSSADFPDYYREISQDLNIAKAEAYEPDLVDRLNRLVLDCHQYLYGVRKFSVKPLLSFWSNVFPAAVRSELLLVIICHLLFYGSSFFVGFFVAQNPESIFQFLSESRVNQIEEMYDPSAERYLKPRNITGDAEMFSFYIYNNISIAFRTFAGGLLAGFGSILFLCYNGIFLGAVSGHLINSGFSRPFFSFVIGHSSFELTAIIFSAMAGLKLGWSLLWTSGLKRADSLKKAARKALPLISGSALMLLIAAVIEAFWSSRHSFPFALRIGTGVGVWIFLIFYFVLAGRKKIDF
jgi:uncharacterized membrane protein SpoIIM required for sporulation